MLFRIAFMCEQKDVGAVYARLTGLKLSNVEPPTPVQVVSDAPATDLISLEGRNQITSQEIIKMLVAGGRSKRSYSYIITKLLKAGAIKKTKKTGIFTVTQGVSK